MSITSPPPLDNLAAHAAKQLQPPLSRAAGPDANRRSVACAVIDGFAGAAAAAAVRHEARTLYGDDPSRRASIGWEFGQVRRHMELVVQRAHLVVAACAGLCHFAAVCAFMQR
eukprot:SAG11_NODE_3082_length_2706_cov_18.779056_1_plen_113_part_00